MSAKRVPRPFENGAAKVCTVNESKVMIPNVKIKFSLYIFCNKKLIKVTSLVCSFTCVNATKT